MPYRTRTKRNPIVPNDNDGITRTTLESIMGFLIGNASATNGCIVTEIAEGTGLSRSTLYRVLRDDTHIKYGIHKVKGKYPHEYYCIADQAARSLTEKAEEEFYLKNISKHIKVPIVQALNATLENATSQRLKKLANTFKFEASEANLRLIIEEMVGVITRHEWEQLALLSVAMMVMAQKKKHQAVIHFNELIPEQFRSKSS